MREFLRGLTGRAVLVTAATAVIAVIVTALVAVPVTVRSVNLRARAELVEKSALAVELLATEEPAVRERIAAGLRQDEIEIYLIRQGAADRSGLPPRVVDRVAAGTEVDTRGLIGGHSSFIAGRPFAEAGSGVVLVQPAGAGIAVRVLGSIWLALLAGLLGGVLAGALLARFLTRPIEFAAAAAGRLAAGDRSVRIPTRGPTEAARLADAINQLAAALQVSEAREREFLLSVSHDLRTPLATLRGYAEALTDGVIEAEDTVATGQVMLTEAERLERLVSDLLVLSRLEAGDLPLDVTGVDLAALVGETGRAWALSFPGLTVEVPDGPVTVTTDPGRIRQVLDGLCENALRVLPEGAPLVLAARSGESGGIVEVRDGGPGLTDDDLAVAFQRGELNRRYRGVRKVGSGLGLALAARLVGRLGGTIAAGHAPEGGAMFTVELPYQA
ncbi:HAMP domain-containing sensor histidine kinase [Actinoplanes sp. NPDC051851]|uniref:sensor histidine kinase n=1 Tax=Actinoplanes sp. NPDC051851 TaxID=3154753 RepID=UPI00342C3B57